MPSIEGCCLQTFKSHSLQRSQRHSALNQVLSKLSSYIIPPPDNFILKKQTTSYYLGRLETTIDISLRDNDCDLVTVVFLRNTTLLGKLDSNVHLLERHDITNAFLETSLSIKIPSLLCRSILAGLYICSFPTYS